jgi:hypothetical protein
MLKPTGFHANVCVYICSLILLYYYNNDSNDEYNADDLISPTATAILVLFSWV